MKGIADTGLLVAFVNRRDAHHDWAISLERQMTVLRPELSNAKWLGKVVGLRAQTAATMGAAH